jgi:hypothetical protein
MQAILSRALEGAHAQGDNLTHDELLAIGRELGVSEDALNAAAEGIGDELAVKRAVDDRIRARRRAFINHLIPFILVNAMLAAINLSTGGPLWFIWPIFGWGIGLVFHAQAAFTPDRRKLEEKARKRLERDREREAKRARRDRAQRSGKRIESAVEDVVAGALGAVADAIEDSRQSRRPKQRERATDGVRVDADPRAGRRVHDAEFEAADEEVAAEHQAGRRRR